MRLTAKPVNPMWDGYKVDIVPHLMDPEGDAVTVLQKIANRLANKYETDVNAIVRFYGEKDYELGVGLIKQNVASWVVYTPQFLKCAALSDEFLDAWVIRKYIQLLDREIGDKIN